MELIHAQIEERSIVLHWVIAQRVSENPALLDVARANLRRWVSQDGERLYWTEWENILKGPLDDLLAFMVSPSEKARRLRQSSPFCGILTPRERWKIYMEWDVMDDDETMDWFRFWLLECRTPDLLTSRRSGCDQRELPDPKARQIRLEPSGSFAP